MYLLKIGSTGNDVTTWQHFLGIEETGTFDDNTLSATKEWQSQHGLTPDGEVGDATRLIAYGPPPSPIRTSVKRAFVPFTSPLEGVVPWMYLDVKGLVTVAIGNLIDPVNYAVHLPFLREDGSAATIDEIATEWRLIKSHAELAHQGYVSARKFTKLHLSAEGVTSVVSEKLEEQAKYLASRFSGFKDWPADAQLATLSMAWACGPAFHFPLLEAALYTADFTSASSCCGISETNNAGIRPRNIANRTLYLNAAQSVSQGLDPETLLYPVVGG